MKGCARSCFLWLAGWAAASAAFYVYLQRFTRLEPQIWWASGGAGLCAVLVWSYVYGIVTTAKERSMLREAAVGGQPQDGKWVAVSGTIRSLNPLRTPMTNVPAVAYEYEVYRITSSGGKNSSSTKHTYYQGKALAASTIATRQGVVRVLAVPSLAEIRGEETNTSQAIANVTEYIQNTVFQTSETPKDKRIGMAEEHADDDGTFRVDKKMIDEPPEIEQCFLDEKHIKQGEAVCAFGLYSAQRGGLVPHPNWAKQARIMRGDATAVAAQLRNRMIKYAVGVVIAGGAAYGIVILYSNAG
ncbi:MAG TPA: hypothetical protein VEK79_08570 [Thermoanaerobaculia bacterium]|nr:hypothetical protein [Thermoanaerobaculia bacterium]